MGKRRKKNETESGYEGEKAGVDAARKASEKAKSGASKGVESLVDGVTLADVAMVAAVPLSRVRYQAARMETGAFWFGEKVYMTPPAPGRASGLTGKAARALYNLVTTGTHTK